MAVAERGAGRVKTVLVTPERHVEHLISDVAWPVLRADGFERMTWGIWAAGFFVLTVLVTWAAQRFDNG